MTEGKKQEPKPDNPKAYKISIKLDQESKELLERYCAQKAVSAGETVRRGIKKLRPELED